MPACFKSAKFDAWLSLVERCVRDAEAAGSNPVASIFSLERSLCSSFFIFACRIWPNRTYRYGPGHFLCSVKRICTISLASGFLRTLSGQIPASLAVVIWPEYLQIRRQAKFCIYKADSSLKNWPGSIP